MKQLFRALLAALDFRRLFVTQGASDVVPIPCVVIEASVEPDDPVQRLREAGL